MTPEAFRSEIPEAKLKDLQRRLGEVNWPLDVENEDWGYGTHGAYLRELVDYWRDGFDWRAQEQAMNAYE
ncbi:MAG: epoxide hydrolase N-terminal domain-containing protein, partial [Myxococcales bacterium]|nr:epoxide hydrolase N-terminal domain-containing protein [Myxococcales bacterium]